MADNKNNKNKGSLSKKTKDELINIIFRKDDKDKKKDEMINNLTNDLHKYQVYQKEYEDLCDEVIEIKQKYKNLKAIFKLMLLLLIIVSILCVIMFIFK